MVSGSFFSKMDSCFIIPIAWSFRYFIVLVFALVTGIVYNLKYDTSYPIWALFVSLLPCRSLNPLRYWYLIPDPACVGNVDGLRYPLRNSFCCHQCVCQSHLHKSFSSSKSCCCCFFFFFWGGGDFVTLVSWQWTYCECWIDFDRIVYKPSWSHLPSSKKMFFFGTRAELIGGYLLPGRWAMSKKDYLGISSWRMFEFILKAYRRHVIQG